MPARVPRDQVTERVGDRLGERGRHPGGQRHTQRVPQPPGVLDGGPAGLAGDPELQRPALPRQISQPARGRGRVLAPLGHLGRGHRADAAQQVRHALGVPAGPFRGQPLQLPLGLPDHHRVQQLAQVSLAEQLGQQRGVQGQRLGPALGDRRVPLVHERADVAEQHRPAKRRRGRGLHVDQADFAAGQVLHEVDEPGHVEHVLQALPDGLQHDRERAVLAGHREKLGGTLALLPQRAAPAGLPPRQQQGAGRALTEPGREQRRAAQLVGDQLLDLFGLQLGDAGRRRLLGVRDADHDPVIGVHGLHVHALVALAQPGRDGQRPRGVHLGAERAVQHQPPVTQLVAEALHDQRAVIGHVAGGLPLRAQVADQVGRGQLVQPVGAQPGGRLLLARLGQLTAVRAERPAQLGGTARRVTVPERQLARLARGGGDQHLVGGDVLDPPRARTQHEHVADPRLVHHFLVELAHPV